LNSYSKYTDAELVQLYKQNENQEVLASLYMRYQPLCLGVAVKYLQDLTEAEDAVVDVFLELVNKVKKYEIDNFRGWLGTVVKNHCLLKLRKRKTTKAYDEGFMYSEEMFHLNGNLEKEEEYKKLEKCLMALNEKQKQAVMLFYLEKKCYQEIAETIMVDWNTVRSQIQNGRRNLKLCMEKNG
jgi:RNA polymerase sigma factor (sigma-70 family)